MEIIYKNDQCYCPRFGHRIFSHCFYKDRYYKNISDTKFFSFKLFRL